MSQEDASKTDRRLLRAFWIIYCLLVLYGSLMPFDFTSDSATFSYNYERAWQFWPVSNKLRVSNPDLISNFILYVPLGFLVACAGRVGQKERVATAAFAALIAGAATSLAVEILQMLSVSRVAGIHDLVMNAAGALAGGMFGAIYGKQIWLGVKRGLHDYWTRKPIAIVAIIMLAALAADALFPFLPTLDVSEVFRNIKRSHLSLTDGLAVHDWAYWLVTRIGIYAVLTVLLAGMTAKKGKPNWTNGAILAMGFAVASEAAKVFISHRFANIANIVTSAGGVGLGLLAGKALQGKISPRGQIWLAWWLILGYVMYMEWGTFDFVWSSQQAAAKMPTGAEWLPLYHYAISGRGEKVHLFVRTIMVVSALSFTRQLLSHRRESEPRFGQMITSGTLRGAALGALLEAGQFFIPGRVPSVTDVFCFAIGGGVGAALAGMHIRRQVRQDQKPKRAPIPKQTIQPYYEPYE